MVMAPCLPKLVFMPRWIILGIAQYISRIGLALDGNSGDSLQQAKQAWMQHPAWQGLRRLCEESLTEQDYFKLFLLQNL